MYRLDERYDIPGLSESDKDWLCGLLGRRPLLQPIVVQEFGRRSVAPPRPMPLTRGETVLLVGFGLWALLGLGCLAHTLGQIVSWLR